MTNRFRAESSSGDEELSRQQRRSRIWNPMLSSTFPNSKRQLQNPPSWMRISTPFRRSLEACRRVSWKWTRCVQRSLRWSSRQYVRMTPEGTVNESALNESALPESSLHSSTASGDLLHHGSATSYPEGSHHGQASLRNSVIEAFTGRNDARNKGDEAVVFDDGTAMDGLTVRSMADVMAVRPVAFSGRTEMCSSSTTRW